MASKHSMIQVLGTTYRLRSERGRHHVIRVSDDRRIGTFQHRPTLRILESELPPEQLLEVARASLRAARLPWTSAELSPRHAELLAPSTRVSRRVRRPKAWASLLGLLWPSV